MTPTNELKLQNLATKPCFVIPLSAVQVLSPVAVEKSDILGYMKTSHMYSYNGKKLLTTDRGLSSIFRDQKGAIGPSVQNIGPYTSLRRSRT